MQLQPVRNQLIVPNLQIINNKNETHKSVKQEKRWKRNPFIEANTKDVDINHLRKDCVIPVFSKDNEVTISHPEFIETV